MANKSKAERSAIAQKAVATRKRNLRLASSNGDTVASPKTRVITRSYDTDLRIAVALLLQKTGVEFPEHLKDVEERLAAKLAPPPAPKPEPVAEAVAVAPIDPEQVNALLSAFADRFGLVAKDVPF